MAEYLNRMGRDLWRRKRYNMLRKSLENYHQDKENMTAKKMISKRENGFLFTYQEFVDEVPPGTYFPGEDTGGVFRLTKARSDGSAMPTDDDFSREVDALLREHDGALPGRPPEAHKNAAGEDTGNGRGNQAGTHPQETGKKVAGSGAGAAQPDLPLRYMDQNYFPMECYVKPFRELHANIYSFLNARDFYLSKRLDYKRAVLIYGDHGVGKTRFLANLSDQLISERDAIVIRVETRKHLQAFISGIPAIADFCRDRLKVIVIEELAELIRTAQADSEILNTLDSTLLKDDLLYLITTNYPEQIPDNIIDRPSRIDDTIAVREDDFDAGFIQAWHVHLTGQPFPQADVVSGFLEKIEGRLSPVYLKELFLRACTRQKTLEETYDELVRRRKELRTSVRGGDLSGLM